MKCKHFSEDDKLCWHENNISMKCEGFEKCQYQKKIILLFDDFKEFIENIEEVDTTYYRGDWDYRRYSNYEIREDGIYHKQHYHDNGIKPPNDGEEKIFDYNIIEEENENE